MSATRATNESTSTEGVPLFVAPAQHATKRAASAGPSAPKDLPKDIPLFVLLTEPDAGPAGEVADLIPSLASGVERVMGFEPRIATASIAAPDHPVAEGDLATSLRNLSPSESTFSLPLILEFDLFAKQQLVEAQHRLRTDDTPIQLHYDDVDLLHPLIEEAFFAEACRQLQKLGTNPSETGILLIANGDSDPKCRAQSYALMRLLWERLGVADADVTFLRHGNRCVPDQLARCSNTPLQWILLPQLLWSGPRLEFVRTLIDDFRKRVPSSSRWALGEPVGHHPSTAGWIQQRLLDLWNRHRSKLETRAPSARYRQLETRDTIHTTDGRKPIDRRFNDFDESARYGSALLAETSSSEPLHKLIEGTNLCADTVFIKVTLHGYATGTYTDAIALDRLLSALPGRAVLLEGHSSSRNTGGAGFDWLSEAKEHRAWIRRQELEYLERTGLREVIDKHGATYLNVTEAWWDGQCADASDVTERLEAQGAKVTNPEVLSFIPRVILDHPGAPFISFARFKGPTRLGISNCFGLIPMPLRSDWHGPNITHFADACCDMATVYGTLLDPWGMVESFNHAVRWNRKGLYRSRWGNYDLIPDLNLVSIAHSLADADILAARLQGQDVSRSAFFDVVKARLPFDTGAIERPIPPGLITRLT